MNVGELVATMDVDDKGYTRGLTRAAAQAKAASTLIERNLDDVDATKVGTSTGTELTLALTKVLDTSGPEFREAGQKAGEEVGEGVADGAESKLKEARPRFAKGGEEAGDGFSGGILGGFKKALPDIGSGGGGLGSAGAGGVMKGLAPLMGNVVVLVGLVAVVLWTLPLLGATVGVALVLAFGAAIAGVGIVAAAQAEKVKDAFGDLKDNVVRDLKSMAAPLEQTLVDVAGDLQSLFDSLSPHLEDAFAEMAPVLS